MKVSDVLKAKGNATLSVEPGKALKDAMDSIMKHHIGALLVMEKENLVGIISERDLFRQFYLYGVKALDKSVSEVMTTDVVVGFPDDDLEAVKAMMTNNRFRHLPIMEKRKVVGIVSIGDVVKILAVNLEIENHYLKDYISGKYPG